MKLHVLSDLHMEFQYFDIPRNDADLVILAGDISNGVAGVEWANNLDKPFIYVPGNHEYYGHEIVEMGDALQHSVRDLVSSHVLNIDYTIIDDVCFIGATLWSDFELYDDSIFRKEMAARSINDFNLIKYNDRNFTPDEAQNAFNYAVNYIRDLLKIKQDYKRVVITHFLPHPNSIADKYNGDSLNPYFCSDLSWLIEEQQPDLWIHGHTHEVCDYKIGKTRVVCNPRGYPGEHNKGFNPNLVIEV